MRIYSIMEELVSADDYLTIDYFAKKYAVSKRTIQNDMSYLVTMSSRHGYQLHMRRGRGYLLEIINQDLLDYFIVFLKSNMKMEAKERTKSIAIYLVCQPDFVSMAQVGDEFQISTTSVKKDLAEVEEFLAAYQLVLEKKRHYGIRVVGDCVKVKKLLFDTYFEDNLYLKSKLSEIEEKFSQVNSLLMKQIEKEELSINYHELKNVIIWLEVSTLYHMAHPKKVSPIRLKADSAIERVCWKLKEMLEANFSIVVNQESFTQIVQVMEINIRQKVLTDSISDSLKQDVEEFLVQVDEEYDTNFQADEAFKESLYMHVSLLIDRLYQKISYKNSLIKEICIRYPMIFNIAILFSDMLKEKYNVEVTQDEAGFIATHFAAHMEKERERKFERFNRIGVVCSSGGGSAFLLKLQIESLFTKAEVEAFNYLQMRELQQFEPDLIFTIMPLSQEFDAPVIFIKEMLDDLDLVRIRQVLQFDNCDSFSIEDIKEYPYEIFNRDFFKVSRERDYLKILTEMAQEIEDCGFGDQYYLKNVLEREEYMSTIYMNGVAIPHPIELSAKKNVLSVCILEEPLMHDGREVQLIFMVCLTKNDYEIHKEITKKLYLLMKDQLRLQYILQHKTFDELMIILKEMDGVNL
ncbi:transcriptional antiterminator, BglG family [Granulicatella balaenopterae]|uniref:Transcriptional antiterminator, BglG family n=1 Tax=Granulicatella balaenopterae TaxID=137733 RepID=A0A1H9LXR0_9LACT|nr:PTS sugar transporter subunit IIA [Granulicatella balaenopterae]SER16079.1 transcriptional antiterminator, BglG family [Granulicatella balaenopterae]